MDETRQDGLTARQAGVRSFVDLPAEGCRVAPISLRLAVGLLAIALAWPVGASAAEVAGQNPKPPAPAASSASARKVSPYAVANRQHMLAAASAPPAAISPLTMRKPHRPTAGVRR